MMFTTQGNTAGAVLMEWNIHEVAKGSVGMWDTIFRVGGTLGTNLTYQFCPETLPYKASDSNSEKYVATYFQVHANT